MGYIRLFQTAIDPSEVDAVRALFNDDVRSVLEETPGCIWVELVVSTEKNAGGLVEGCVISKWDSLANLEAGLESRGVQEALVRVRGLFRQEPVIKVYEVLE